MRLLLMSAITVMMVIVIYPALPKVMDSKSIMTLYNVSEHNLIALMLMSIFIYFYFPFTVSGDQEGDWRYPLCVQKPPVQLSVATATPSHSRPPCLGSGAVHSLLRCLSQSELHTDHSLHSSQPPSTEGSV